MTALLEITPRAAGTRTLEPAVTFDAVEQAVFGQDRCPASCVCSDPYSNNCIATGRSLAE